LTLKNGARDHHPMTSRRARIPAAIQEQVITESARRCALCFGLTGSLRWRRGQIAHVDRNKANAKLANLAYLCLPHHDAYDGKPSQSKGFMPGELRQFRRDLYKAIARGRTRSGSTSPRRRSRPTWPSSPI